MARKKGRRRYSPNRRLPTRSAGFTPAYTIEQLRDLIGVTRSYEVIPSTRVKQNAYARQRRLANNNKSNFPKTYGVQSPAVAEDRKVMRQMDLCLARAKREEVMHAIGKAGKVGQKRPNWTKKSKVRC